jgi:hypothetical protein
MKKLFFAALFAISFSCNMHAQCLDALVTTKGDTIFGMVVSVTDSSYTIDSYNYVASFKNDMITEYIQCIRQLTQGEIARMKHVDYLTESDLLKYTSGYYLRKAYKSFYLGLSLDLLGGIAIGTSLHLYKDDSDLAKKWIFFSAGTTVFAGGIFFLLRSFYFIDKTGKLMDLEHSAIYLEATKNGGFGVSLKF